MPSAAPTGRGQQPGRFWPSKQLVRAPFERVKLPTGADEPTLYWNADGVLFNDKALTEPAGLVIVALPHDEDDD